jgi:hypothetical protein
MRYGFLFTGYEIDRLSDQSGLVVSWEATVMIRKLFITLAGATISDAYLQILAGQMILISAVVLQAYFQPYIPDLLDVLDTLGLFSLLCTQVLSILYLYSETSERPVLPKKSLEIVVTVALFLLNAIMICIFALVWFWYCVGCDFKKLRCRKLKQMRLVKDDALIAQGNVDEEEAPKLYWRHPITSLAQTHPPQELLTHDGTVGCWVYTDTNGKKSWSDSAPEVVSEIPDGEEAKTGEFTCMLDPKTMSLSPLLEVPPDVMSDPNDVNNQAQDRREVNGNIVAADNGDIEMVENPGGRIDQRRQRREERKRVRLLEMVQNPMAANEDLHIGWRIQVNTDGTEYYVNDETGETTFEKPKLPHGWKKAVSKDHDGMHYFVNQHTGETVWDPPILPAPPAGYNVYEHTEKGHFFQHKETGESSWTHPDVPID